MRVAPRLSPLVAVATLLSAASIVGVGCGGEDPENAAVGTGGGTATSVTTATGDTTTTGGGEGGDDTPEPLMRKTIAGDVTWQVTFDDAAKAAGATDCTYTRHYEGVEDASIPWLCPACEVLFRADVAMTAGQDDCFTQISDLDPSPTEWIGYGGGSWWRSVEGPTTQQGTAEVTGDAVATTNLVEALELPAGGTFKFDVSGALTTAEKEGDPMQGWVAAETYACGWPKSDAPPYEGDYVLAKGEIMPDGLFKDACGDTVRLHDLRGTYLVVDMSARDCPPCQQMAGDEEAWVEEMAGMGIDVRVVTLLAPSLDDVFGDTTQAQLNTWITKYDITSPVLADRSWGFSMFFPAIGEATGYPSWAVVDPDLRVLELDSGYGGMELYTDIIVADAQ
jgi:peroxiredoxin